MRDSGCTMGWNECPGAFRIGGFENLEGAGIWVEVSPDGDTRLDSEVDLDHRRLSAREIGANRKPINAQERLGCWP